MWLQIVFSKKNKLMDNPVNVGNILYANEAQLCLFALDQIGSVSFNPQLFSAPKDPDFCVKAPCQPPAKSTDGVWQVSNTRAGVKRSLDVHVYIRSYT